MTTSMRPFSRSLLALAAGFSLFSMVAAQAADHRLTDIKLDFGSLLIAMPEIHVQGTDLTEAELRDILSVRSATPVHERMAKLSATAIIIPRLDIGQKIGKFSGLSSHQDVRLEDVRAGRAARGKVGTARTSGNLTPGETFTGEQGPSRFEGLDFKALAEAMTLTRPAGTKPAYQTILASWQTDWSRSSQSDKSESRTGVQTGRNLKLSPGTTAQSARWDDLMAVLESLLSMDKAGKDAKLPEELKDVDRLLRLVGMLDDFSLEDSEARDFHIQARPKDKDTPPVDMTIKRVAVTMPGGGAASGIVVEDMAGTVDKVRFALKSISTSGFSPADGYEALARKLRPLIEGGRLSEIWSVLPTIGSLKFGGFSMDVPQGAGKAANEFTPFQKIALGNFEITTRAARNGIPTDMAFALQGLTVPVDPKDAKQKDLVAMGFKELNIGAAIDLGWDEAKREIALRRFDLDMADGIRTSLSGVIGQATAELFTPDLNVQQMAALGLTLKGVKLDVANLGLIDKFAAMTGKAKGKSGDDVKREWATLAALAVPAMLGASDEAKAIASALGRFIAKPGKLTIEGTARNKDGVGLADVMAAGGDAKALLPAFQVKAAAE